MQRPAGIVSARHSAVRPDAISLTIATVDCQIGEYVYMGRRSKVCVAKAKNGETVALKGYVRAELRPHDMCKVRSAICDSAIKSASSCSASAWGRWLKGPTRPRRSTASFNSFATYATSI